MSQIPVPSQIIVPTPAKPVVPLPVPSSAVGPGSSSVNITPSAPINGVPEIFTRLGFVPAGSTRTRLFITSEGPTGSGKTHFIRTMPGPIGVIDFDRGTEGVLDVFRNSAGLPVNVYGQPILRKTIEFAEFDEGGKSTSASELAAARSNYQIFKYLVEQMTRSSEVRTLVVDTGGAAYSLAQAARFGQLAAVGEVPPNMWTSMQMEYENLFLQAYEAGCNVLVTHRQGSKFKGLAGEKELKGYKLMPFVGQVHLVHQKKVSRVPVDPSNPMTGMRELVELSIKVEKCRQRWTLNGHEFPIVMLGEDPATGVMQSIGGTFLDVAKAVLPITTDSDWI